LAEKYNRGHTEKWELFISIQSTIEAIDRALADEGQLGEGLAGDQAFGWVTNKPSRVACARYSFRDSSGSFATLAAIRPPLGQRHLCAHFA
jgi:hypothetical protein